MYLLKFGTYTIFCFHGVTKRTFGPLKTPQNKLKSYSSVRENHKFQVPGMFHYKPVNILMTRLVKGFF